jgi:uncharacterized protein YjhX (UPF0386 family)
VGGWVGRWFEKEIAWRLFAAECASEAGWVHTKVLVAVFCSYLDKLYCFRVSPCNGSAYFTSAVDLEVYNN